MNPFEPRRSPKALENPPIREAEDLASANDCTGLVPAAIQDEYAAEDYAKLYAIHEQKPTRAEPLFTFPENPCPLPDRERS